jgi:hypothetical protein
MLKRSVIIAAIATTATAATFVPTASAGDPALGALVGAGIGAAIGNSVNGHNGAWVGGALGAVTGATIAANSGGYYDGGNYAPSYGYASPPPVSYGPAVTYYAPAATYYAPPIAYRPRPVYVHPYRHYYPVRSWNYDHRPSHPIGYGGTHDRY